MSTRGIIQASLEFWGSVIYRILLLTSMLDREYKGGSKRDLLALYLDGVHVRRGVQVALHADDRARAGAGRHENPTAD